METPTRWKEHMTQRDLESIDKLILASSRKAYMTPYMSKTTKL